MRNKNIFNKHFNIRFLKSIICNLAAKSKFLQTQFNIYNKAINIKNLLGKEIFCHNFQGETKLLIKEIENVFIVGKAGLSIDEKSKKIILLDEKKNPPNFTKPVLAKNKIVIDEDFFVINAMGIYKGHRHYFHFFFDYFIPLFFYLNNFYKDKKIKIIIRQDLSEFQRKSFEFLQKDFPNIEFISAKNNDKIYCKKMIYISFPHLDFYDVAKNLKIKKLMISFQKFFYEHFGIRENSTQKNIYISRYDAKIRQIKNEEEFLGKLQKFNFEKYQLAKLSFKEQIELFSRAGIIVGAHGAGFTNLIFARKNTVLIEIFPSSFYDEGFVLLAKMMEIKRYEIIENNGDKLDNFTLSEENMNKILKLIE